METKPTAQVFKNLSQLFLVFLRHIWLAGSNQRMKTLDIEFSKFMQDKKGQTQKLILERVAEGPGKNQLSANMNLVKLTMQGIAREYLYLIQL